MKLHTLLTTLILVVIARAQDPSPHLIPFQGRLTNQAGVAYTSGQYSITFNLYSQAVGGTALWTERHQKIGVVNGMVNVFLGSIPGSNLGNVDFTTVKHLGITIDADDNPNTADPEMVPRQMIIPAFHAKGSGGIVYKDASNAVKIGDWSKVLTSANPEVGTLLPGRFGNQTIAGTKLENLTITGDKIAAGAITFDKIGQRPTGANVGIGGVAISAFDTAPYNIPPGGSIAVANCTVTIETTGRPVFIGLTGDGADSYFRVDNNDGGTTTSAGLHVKFQQVGGANNALYQCNYFTRSAAGFHQANIPPSAFWTVTTALPAGVHTIRLVINRGESANVSTNAVRIIAYEL